MCLNWHFYFFYCYLKKECVSIFCNYFNEFNIICFPFFSGITLTRNMSSKILNHFKRNLVLLLCKWQILCELFHARGKFQKFYLCMNMKFAMNLVFHNDFK